MAKNIILPVPIGDYKVGITHSECSYHGHVGEDRKVPITIFYPADDSEGNAPYPYAFAEAFFRTEIAERYAGVQTHCFKGVALSTKKAQYPLLIYNQSYGGYEMQNTVLCSDLTSSGYIVASLGHPGESAAVKYLDGRIERINQKYIDAMSDPKLFEALNPLLDQFISIPEENDEELIELSRAFFAAQGCFNVRVKVWVADIVEAANHLEKLNNGGEESIFTNRLALSKGIGLCGHSFGGSSALQAMIEDERFSCGVNTDGGHFGDYFGEDINKPLLQIGNPNIWKMLKVVFLRNSEVSYHVTVEDADHIGFTDQIFLIENPKEEDRLGTRDPMNFRELLTNYHLRFFEQYLLKTGTILNDLGYEKTRYYEKGKKYA